MRVETADLLVVGTGPAGLAAAAEAARSGARVVAVDESPAPGGCLRFQIERADRGAGAGKPQLRPGAGEAARLTQEAAEAGARVLSGISVWGLFPEWEAYLSPVGPREPDDSPDAVRARAVVAATGAVQNPVGIPGWTLPGVLSPGGVQSLISLHRVRPGRRAVVIGTDLLGVITAGHLSLAGIEVTAVLPPAAGPYTRDPHDPYAAGSEIDRVAALWGVPLRRGRGAAAIIGDDRVRAVAVVPLDASVHAPGGDEERWEVDLAVISGGLSPLVNLVHAAGCPVVHIPDLGGHVPLHGPDLETPLPRVFVAGSVAGAAGAQAAEAQGRVAGLAAARRLGFLDGGAADSRLVQAESRLAEAFAEMPAFVPDAERGLRRMAQLWAARPAASGVDPGITAAQE